MSLAARRRPVPTGRVGALLAAHAFAVTMLGTTLPTPLYPIYRAGYGFSQLLITVIFGTYAIGVIAALLLVGGLSDSIGRRRTLLPGLALSAASAVAFLAAHGLALILLGRLLSGLSAGVFTGTATATIVELTPAENRSRATLVATMANLGGLGCGPLLAGLLAQYARAPLRLPFVVDLVLLGSAVAAIWRMPESAPNSGRVRLRPQRLTVPAQVRTVFVRGAIAAFAGFSVLGLFTAVAPAFLGQILHVRNYAVIGLVVCAVFAASSLGQVSLERAPGRGLALGCACLVAGMAVFAVALAVSSLVLLVIGGCVAGFGQGLSFRDGLTGVNNGAPAEQRGVVASTFFVVAYVAISLPVVGVGMLAQLATLRVAGLTFSGVVIALALVALGLLLRGGVTTEVTPPAGAGEAQRNIAGGN